MTSLDVGIAALRSSLTALRSSVAALPSVRALRAAADRGYELYDRSSATLKGMMPKGLYARALLIIIAPMVVLQSVVAFMFIKRHYPARQESNRARGSLERAHARPRGESWTHNGTAVLRRRFTRDPSRPSERTARP